MNRRSTSPAEPSVMVLEDRFDPAFAAAVVLKEKQIQQSYRPHLKWLHTLLQGDAAAEGTWQSRRHDGVAPLAVRDRPSPGLVRAKEGLPL